MTPATPSGADFVVKTLGTETLSPEQALDPTIIKKISARINELAPPRIFSDVVMVKNGHEAELRTEDQLRQQTKGFRIFGQRFTVDAWILYRLNSVVKRKMENGREVRLPSMPSALFVPAVLGDAAARDLSEVYLAEEYDPRFTSEDLAKFFARMDEVTADVVRVQDSEWFGSMGAAWLNTFRTLGVTFGPGYPLYMANRPFSIKQIQTCLGSYAELKRDTILYAKQSYTSEFASRNPRPLLGIQPLRHP